MANLWQPSINRVVDDTGAPAAGAELRVYLTGTTTPATYYLDADGDTPGPFPQTANADGIMPPVYMDPNTTYRMRCTTADGSELIYDVDPVAGFDESEFREIAVEVAEDAAAAEQAKVGAEAAEAGSIEARNESEDARDDAETAAQQAIAAAATPALLIQTDPDTPTVPPSGSSSGEYYWTTDEDGEHLTLYLNTAGTGAPVDPLIQVTQGKYFNGSAADAVLDRDAFGALPGPMNYVIEDTEERMGWGISVEAHIVQKDTYAISDATLDRDAEVYSYYVEDVTGAISAGTEITGKGLIVPNRRSLGLISSGIQISVASLWRGTSDVTDIWRSTSAIRAYVEDETASIGWGGTLVQAVGSTSSAEMAAYRMRLRIHHGQSNATTSGTDVGTLLSSAIFPHHSFKFTAGSGNDGSAALNINTLTDVVANSSDAGATDRPQVDASFASNYAARLRGYENTPTITTNVALGSQSITYFIEGGSYAYPNFDVYVQAGYAFSQTLALDYEWSWVWIQGEDDGGMAVATYAGHLNSIIDGHSANGVTNVNRAPSSAIIIQVNGPSSGSGAIINPPLADLSVTIPRRGTTVVLGGPMYWVPLSDTIHADNRGRLLIGELIDRVEREILLNGSFTPLDVLRDEAGNAIGIQRSGATITVTLNRPVELDDDWVPSVGSAYGFTFTDGGSTSISSVTVTNGSPVITITLSGSPTGTKTLGYANAACAAPYRKTGGASVITASISGTVMTVSAITGTLAVGDAISGPGILRDQTIASFGTGSGGTGTYNLSINNGTIASGTKLHVPNWAAPRGSIYALSGVPSPYYMAGYPVPPVQRDYLVRLQETIS